MGIVLALVDMEMCVCMGVVLALVDMEMCGYGSRPSLS